MQASTTNLHTEDQALKLQEAVFDKTAAHDSFQDSSIHLESRQSQQELFLSASLLLLFSLALTTATPEAAQAATTVNSAPIPNALVAYGHYVSLFMCMAILTFERTTVQAGMDIEAEKAMVKADVAYGLTALVVGVTGIYRAVEYGKGWEFYSHEPLFWLKLAFAGLWAGLRYVCAGTEIYSTIF